MENTDAPEILRLLPSIDALLRSEIANKILPETGAKHLTGLARTVAERDGPGDGSRVEIDRREADVWRFEQRQTLRTT